jgi:dolichyl-phosphate beta-glucosyltransferase
MRPLPERLDLSVIIPAFNEGRRIRRCLHDVIDHLAQRGLAAEVLVVDDGSTDDTSVVVEAFAEAHSAVRLIRMDHNRGKGAAVRTGIRHAGGSLVLFADADGATPFQELDRLRTSIREGAEIAIGSRALASRDHQFTVNARWHRSLLGNLFNLGVRILGPRGLADTQCGFKLFRGPVARDLFAVSRINGYGFDLEILYVAQARGYRIAEVPINWSDQPGSKVRVLPDGARMLGDLLAIRRRHAAGLYASAPDLTRSDIVASSLEPSP